MEESTAQSPRQKSRLKTFLLAAVAGALLIVLVVAAIIISNHYLQQPAGRLNSGCSGTYRNHLVVIANNTVTPQHTTAPKCDTLTIVNKDSITRLMAFGPHEHHVAYDGVTERILTKGQSLTVTLVQTGNFQFHDHIHDSVRGTFTVTE